MEGSYEYELERAELLGVEPLSRAEWEKQQSERKEVEQEQEQNEIAQELEAEDEKLKAGSGKMDELNSILNVTQQKINKFKTVCGSFTGLLKISSRTASPAPAETSDANGQVPTTSSDINSALDDLEQIKEIQGQSDVEFAKNQAADIGEKATKNLSALDRLLAKAENAQIAMAEQNQQMKKFLKK